MKAYTPEGFRDFQRSAGQPYPDWYIVSCPRVVPCAKTSAYDLRGAYASRARGTQGRTTSVCQGGRGESNLSLQDGTWYRLPSSLSPVPYSTFNVGLSPGRLCQRSYRRVVALMVCDLAHSSRGVLRLHFSDFFLPSQEGCKSTPRRTINKEGTLGQSYLGVLGLGQAMNRRSASDQTGHSASRTRCLVMGSCRSDFRASY